jgi:hypothetical protein
MGWLNRVRTLLGRRPQEGAPVARASGLPDRVRASDERPIKSPPMQIDGRVMSASEFVAYIEGLEMPEPLPTRFFLHHTWRPTRESWRGHSTILAMKRYYEQQLWRDAQGRLREGWTVGPHLFVADDGIWLFSDIRYDGVGVYGHNYRSRHLEMVGNYDEQPPSGPTLRNTIVALGILHEKFGLDIRNLYFHRDFSTKSCPGWAVRKEWIIPQVERWIQEYRAARQPRPQPEDDLASLRVALKAMLADLLVDLDLESPLTLAAQERGLLGPLTRQVPIEIEEQGYLVQFFAEALLAPANRGNEVVSLGEFEAALRDQEPEPSPEDEQPAPDEPEPDADLEQVVDTLAKLRLAERAIKAPPSDPYQFSGRIR